jgi:hypothetical protein
MTVGGRMAAILNPDDAPAAREPEVRAVLNSQLLGGKPANFEKAVVDVATGESVNNRRQFLVEPELPPEVAERIRPLLAAGDWRAAASYAEAVMASVGIDPAPELQTGAQPSRGSDSSDRASDAREADDRGSATPPDASRAALGTGPTVSARMGSIFGNEADEGGHPSY